MSRPSGYLDQILKYRIVNHCIFWISISLVLAYHGSLFGGSFQDNLFNMVALLPVQMLAAYLLIYVQIPKWLFKGAWLRFGLSLFVVSYLCAVLGRLVIIHLVEPILGIEAIDESLWEIFTDPLYLLKVYIPVVYFPAVIVFLIKMTKDRFVQQRFIETLEKEKRTSELNFLKAQMNPHFLFNTLNNIYAMSKNHSEGTSEMIHKLSDILDYTIYQCRADRVPIEREWILIENYSDLQAIRYDDKLTLVLEQKIDDPSAEVAPLILISFVENAFKHALQGAIGNPKIRIALEVSNGILRFEVVNTKGMKKIHRDDAKKGIGVKNVKRQLELQYPNQYQLQIENQDDEYKLILSLNL